ncbi:MAG: hypothetical protein QOI10_1973 [Solirubrobacterales bacterium]|nr:hypothetical protein [Solirubrobacterales bacterium]
MRTHGGVLSGRMGSVRVTAKAEYAVRAVMELAGGEGEPVKRDTIVAAQAIPPKFLENILSELRHAGLVESQRGSEGGYWLALPPEKITVADIMRAVEGPLASVRSSRPETLEYEGLAEPLQYVWVALRTSIRTVLDRVTVADLISGKLPKHVIKMTEDPDSWISQ